MKTIMRLAGLLIVSVHVITGCSTVYQYDVNGNLTCVDSGALSLSNHSVPPPVISIGGEAFGCPRRVTVDIASPAGDSIRYSLDGLSPTEASPVFDQPLTILLRKRNTLDIKAIAVNQCGAVSPVAGQKTNCVGDYLKTPIVSHWFDLPFPWPGKKPYDDVVYQNMQLPSGCIVTDIHLELLNRENAVIEYAYPEYSEATDGHTGASIRSYSLNHGSLELKVNSWHLFGFRVKYDVVYFVRGNNCALPPFVYRTE